MKKLSRFSNFKKIITAADRRGARYRLWVLVILLLGFISVFGALFNSKDVSNAADNLARNVPLVDLFPRPLIWLLALFVTPQTLRFALIPVAVLALAFFLGSLYLQDIYDLKSRGSGLRYLLASLFGSSYPVMRIGKGGKSSKTAADNILEIIGGPGIVKISPGNAVLFESLNGPTSIHSAGKYFIARFDRVKEIISLEDQSGGIEQINAITKDGIEIIITDVSFRYRLLTGQSKAPYANLDPSNPYPYSDEAVLNMTYQRSVSKNGIAEWLQAIKLVVDSIISGYVSRHFVDELTAPGYSGKDPRREIQLALASEDVKNALANLGAELIWVDIGHFEVKDKQILEQRINVWQNRWVHNADVLRADSDARHSIYQEIGRAEAQAELLTAIARGLKDVNIQGNADQNMRSIVLVQMAQLLEAIGEQNQLPPDQLPGGTLPGTPDKNSRG